LEVTTLALVPQVVNAVGVPVVAAGGIVDGRGIAAVMALGAEGVQMGTRFIATQECKTHDTFKKLILDADDIGTCIIGRKLNLMRVIRTEFALKMEQAEKAGASNEDLFEIIGDERNRSRSAAKKGDIKEGTFQAGQSSGLINDILSVSDLIKRLIAEYESARKALQPLE
jgi:enoyl-[acyl-carrier protein] reductase II